MTATQVVHVQGSVQLQCFRAQKGQGNWVGVCEPLKLTIQAETWADLMEDFGLTLDAVMKDLVGSNELKKFLTEKGWRLGGALPRQMKNVRFDVPFIPEMARSQGQPTELHQ